MFDFAQHLSTRLRRLVAPRAEPCQPDRIGTGASRLSIDDVIHLADAAMPNAEHGTCHVGAYVPALRPTIYLRRGAVLARDGSHRPSDLAS